MQTRIERQDARGNVTVATYVHINGADFLMGETLKRVGADGRSSTLTLPYDTTDGMAVCGVGESPLEKAVQAARNLVR